MMRWRLFTRSLTARFVILAFAFELAVMGGVLIFVQQASQHALTEEQQALVGDLTDELTGAYRQGGAAELAGHIRSRLLSVNGGNVVILLTSRDGAPLLGNLGAWPTVISQPTAWRAIELYRMGSDHPEHMGVAATYLPNGMRLLTGQVIDGSVRLARINNEAILAALIVGLSLALVSALLLGRLLSTQIDRIVSTAGSVGRGSLGQRVPLDGSGDAFDALAHAINGMLDRIEALVSQLRMMTDGLAHDLKSPVTRLKSVLERAMTETDDQRSLAALERVSGEAETLLSMLSMALLISRTEAGIGREGLVKTDVRQLFEDLAEIYGPLIEDNGFAITVAVQGDIKTPLHRELVSQALGNLIENALKYAAGGNAIILAAELLDGGVRLVVADNGPGIPTGRRADAVRRFGRLDPARHVAGSGLGLALVEAVAKLHGGTIALEDNHPGLRVVLDLES